MDGYGMELVSVPNKKELNSMKPTRGLLIYVISDEDNGGESSFYYYPGSNSDYVRIKNKEEAMFEEIIDLYLTTPSDPAKEAVLIVDDIHTFDINKIEKDVQIVYNKADKEYYLFMDDQFTSITEDIRKRNIIIDFEEDDKIIFYSPDCADAYEGIEDETTGSSDDIDEEEVNDDEQD